jgi:hypothetical protein
MHSKKIVGIDWTPAAEHPSIIPLHASTAGSLERRQIASNRSEAGTKDLPPASETSGESQSNRLPRYDSRTSRCEFGVFAGLGLTALALIGTTLLESGRFAENRDAIINALATGQAGSPEFVCCPTNHAVTNLSVIPAAAHSERAS